MFKMKFIIFAATVLGGANSAAAQSPFEKKVELAASGDLASQLSVAQAYQYGLGTDKNIDEAINWYEMAAAQSDPLAMYELGGLVYKGIEPDDDSEAANQAATLSVSWYEMSAKTGFPQAQSTLGLLYGFGDRVGADTVTGRMWLAIAQINGIEPSITMVKMLEDRMSEAERAQAIENAEICISSDYTNCN